MYNNKGLVVLERLANWWVLHSKGTTITYEQLLELAIGLSKTRKDNDEVNNLKWHLHSIVNKNKGKK